jgi:toxin ParE1/3/4
MCSAQVRLTAGAERDLSAIYRRRLAVRGAEGDDGAEAHLAKLVAAIESLAHYSERGPVPPELEVLGIREYRQLSVPPYRIIYWPKDDIVTIMLVADARRDFRTLLEERVLG